MVCVILNYNISCDKVVIYSEEIEKGSEKMVLKYFFSLVVLRCGS